LPGLDPLSDQLTAYSRNVVGHCAAKLRCAAPVGKSRLTGGAGCTGGVDLDGIGAAYVGLGRLADGVRCHEEAHKLFRELGERDGEAWALNGLGEAARKTGDLERATAHHATALSITTEATRAINRPGPTTAWPTPTVPPAMRIRPAGTRSRH
jgi:hypothetical protein